MTDPVKLPNVDWDDPSELHEKNDGGGLLSHFKAIRQGTLADLVHFVASLPEEERDQYVIEKGGDRRLIAADIMLLARRPDYPFK